MVFLDSRRELVSRLLVGVEARGGGEKKRYRSHLRQLSPEFCGLSYS